MIKLSRGRVVVGLALLIAGVVAACKASGRLQGTGELFPGLPVGIDVRVGQGGTVTANNETGKCYELKWRDAAGAELGTVTLRTGATAGQVPAGAVLWTATEVPCPPPAGGGGTGGAGGGMLVLEDGADGAPEPHSIDARPQRTAAGPVLLDSIRVFGAPVVIDDDTPFGNAFFEFLVRAPSSNEASVLALGAVRSSVGSPIDPRITIVTWLRGKEVAGGASIVALAPAQFTHFDCQLNGATVSDLATNNNAAQAMLANGLWKLEFTLASGSLNGNGQWNRARVTHSHGGLPTGETKVVVADYLYEL